MPDFRPLRALTALTLLAGGPACRPSPEVDARQIFPDPTAAELADAAARGDTAEVRRLVAEGADPNAQGDKGVTVAQWALLHRSAPGMAAVVRAGADPARPDSSGETVVHYAAKAEDPVYLEALLAAGADPNTPHAITRAPPIMAALLGNRETHFKALLAAGADPNRADRMGDTPLHLAGKINATRRVLDLLDAGADPAATNQRGTTFLTYLDRTPRNILSADALRDRDSIDAWLRAHGHPR